MKSPHLAHFMPNPGEALDWKSLSDAFPWIEAMKGSTQDPVHHAEGDVWVHTRMVTEELVTSSEWQSESYENRFISFAAAVLHDVAKPRTRTAIDGRITNPGHSRVGAIDARNILWEMNVPINIREEVCAIIRVHQWPFYAVERLHTDREWEALRVLAATSFNTTNKKLAMMAEADLRGRICSDHDKILDNIELFRYMAQELDCFEHPFKFHNDHTRLKYFQEPDRFRPEAIIFDDTSDDFVMTVISGLAGAGKSHWVKEATSDRGYLAGQPVISLDGIRSELKIKPTDNQGMVSQLSKQRAKEYLGAKRSFVWDATNVGLQQREPLTAMAMRYGARVRMVYIEASISDLLAGNKGRDQEVPLKSIQRMRNRWEPPTLAECHVRENFLRSEYALPGEYLRTTVLKQSALTP
ncbi:AAA family ATPase [Thalassospira xianhensis]|uniref:AAA family ATPase n=1 Tax=Thalassospira xianhensis TaxID=478503 RepID=UPI000DEDC305|nr:AAA family ATPase [Thalassospira xianhensis]